MPTKTDRRAPIDSVSVPTRTICTTTRWRSTGTKADARTAAVKSDAASPSTWSTSRSPAPSRPIGPGRRGTRPIASTAMAGAPVEVTRADEPLPLAREQPPAEVPGGVTVGLRVPPVEAVERRPERQDAAVLRHQAVKHRRHLAEPSSVRLDAPADREDRRQLLPVAGGLVRLALPPPEDQERVVALVVEIVRVLAADAVGRPRVEARRERRPVRAPVERREAPGPIFDVAERALAIDERERAADRLVRPLLVDGVGVGEDAVETAPALRAVDRAHEREIDARLLPAVAGHEALAPDVERPEDVARPLGADPFGAAVDRPEPESAAVGPAHRGHEREGEEAPFDARLGEAEIRWQHDGAEAIEAVEVRHVEVERQDAEVGAECRARAVEDEREELEPARPRRRAALGLRCRTVAVREEQEAKRVVLFEPARRDEREEDVGLVVALERALLTEPAGRADPEIASLGRARELHDRPEGAPADDVVRVVARVAEERPELHVEGGRGTRERRKTAEQEGGASTGRSQWTSDHAPGSDTRRSASGRRTWWSSA